MSNIIQFRHRVNNVDIEQRRDDGFINATAMAVAYHKDVSDWLRTDDTWELVSALASDLGTQINSAKKPNSVRTRVSESYPSLVMAKRGSPENGGGTWIHPDLAVPFAQWCNKAFAIQVGRWIREWFASVNSSPDSDIDQELIAWTQRRDIRVYLKDFLRPELMRSVVKYALKNNLSPRKLCASVHDQINQRIQGLKSKQIKALNGLPLGELIRDYFDAPPLVTYSAINKLAKNAIDDKEVDPITAVNQACDSFLGVAYVPKPVKFCPNLYSEGKRLKSARRKKSVANVRQLSLFDVEQTQIS